MRLLGGHGPRLDRGRREICSAGTTRDPAWADRRHLLRGRERLTEQQFTRMWEESCRRVLLIHESVGSFGGSGRSRGRVWPGSAQYGRS
jgi:hypothetical protein